jgi:steroid 5-alpha reductase family enzyme
MIAAIARSASAAPVRWRPALQLVLWLVQQRTRSAGIVDVGRALSFALVIAAFVRGAASPNTAWGPLAAIVLAWSLRLGGYLIARGAARSPEEGRYVDLRQRWAPRASVRFFVFFQAQAALAGILATAFVVPFVAVPWDSGWLRAIGAAIAVAGIAGEATADAQLVRWKRDPRHRGQVCDAGLWAASRHPNYFFEWTVWVGYAVYGLAFPMPCGPHHHDRSPAVAVPGPRENARAAIGLVVMGAMIPCPAESRRRARRGCILGRCGIRLQSGHGVGFATDEPLGSKST